MTREAKSTNSPLTAARAKASVELVTSDDGAVVSIVGLVDERFGGFGQVPGAVKTLVIDVSGVTRMTSFGVRQWLKGMDALPKTIGDIYLLACPTFFVDQLNMVLNFGGASKILTVIAPYTCPSCGVESGEMIDILVERANLVKGIIPEKECSRCGGKLEFDETPESYFSFVSKYGATSIHSSAAMLLAKQGKYTANDAASEKPPRIIKLVHGSVTYFRIIGSIGAMFRSRPFLVGAEGEVVIDLADVDRFDPAGKSEWQRLLKSLTGLVPTVTLVDVNDSFLAAASDTLSIARNLVVASVLVPYCCIDCGRVTQESVAFVHGQMPPLTDQVCSACDSATRNELTPEMLAPLRKAVTATPPESAKVIEMRGELLSRAMADASVAQGGNTPPPVADDMILGKYKIVKKLSAGGMAEVFLANQVGIGGFEKPVALKRIQHKLLESRRQAIELFLNEAKIAGRLMHPNIVQVLDVGEAGGALYLAMEFVHGRDLRDVAKSLRASKTTMPLGEACYIIREVAQALHHAYWSTDMAGNRLSVVHRDVSPHNIILGYDGTVKLLDFGVAMSAITEHAETLIVGKWTYMSPETTMNGQTDHRSDLFSLGVILYLLCSGSMPFFGSEPKEIVRKIRGGQYKPLAEIAPNVPERLATLVGRLLAPNPEHRPQRGQEVVAELNDIMQENGVESSGPAIAELLTNLFPLTGGPVEDEAPLREIVRRYDDSGKPRVTPSDYSPSITPSAGTHHRIADVSETFHRVTPSSFSASHSIPPRRPSVQRFPVAPPTKTRDRLINIAIVIVIAALLGVVAYFVESSY